MPQQDARTTQRPDRDELEALRRPSNWRALWVCAVNFLLVALGFALPIMWPHPLGWVLGAVLLGGRAMGLGILVHAFQLKNFRLRTRAPFLLAHTLLLGLLIAAGAPEVYACWWLGQIFVFPLVMRLRVMGEHGGVPDHTDPDARRNTGTTLAGPLARLLCAPNRVNFHVEHHLAAAVPSYRLPRLHRMLAKRGYFDEVACVMPSYLAVIRRCLARNGREPAIGSHRAYKTSLANMQ
jgi:fatty acid desaturase